MKKKLLTLALSAVMTLSMSISAFSDAQTITSTEWWAVGSHSTSWEIEDTESFEFDVKGGESNWNNVLIVLANTSTTEAINNGLTPTVDNIPGYAEYAAIRMDSYGWGAAALAYESTIVDANEDGDTWDDFRGIMADAHIDMTITRSASDVVIVSEIEGANGASFTYTVTATVDTSAGLHVFFVADASTFTVDIASSSNEVSGPQTITSTEWWAVGSHSTSWEVAETRYFELDVKGGESNWNNVLIVLANTSTTEAINNGLTPTVDNIPGYAEYAAIRMDSYGWGAAALAYESTIVDANEDGDTWDDFRGIMADAHIDMTVTRSASDVVIVSEVEGANGASFTYTVTATVDTSAGLHVFFVADASTFTVECVESLEDVAPEEPSVGEGETDVPSTDVPSTGDGEDETTAPDAPSTGDGEDETDAPSTDVPSTGDDEDETDAPSTDTTTPAEGTVTEEEVKDVQEAAKTEGENVPADAELVVNNVDTKSDDYKVVTEIIEKEHKDKAFVTLDLKLVKEDVAVQPNGKIKVTLPVVEELKAAKMIQVYRIDDGKKVDLGKVEVKDGKFTFETDHFSTYVFVSADVDTTTPTTPNTGDATMVGLLLAVAAVSAVIVLKKRTVEE